jgi:hypothetical protein
MILTGRGSAAVLASTASIKEDTYVHLIEYYH